QWERWPYLAMKLVDGGDLGALIGGGPLEPSRAVVLVSQVAAALDAAHGAGLVHRDVKPANVLVEHRPDGREHCYLADFGLVKAVTGSRGLTGASFVLGTPEYLSPEQAQQRPVDHRTDVYSLGCLLFECLTGRPPYERATALDMLNAHVDEPPPVPTGTRPDLPVGFDHVVTRAMAKAPADRYQSCGDLARAAAAVVGDAARLRVPPAPGPGRAPGPAAGHRRLVVVGVVAVLAVATAVAITLAAGGGGSGTVATGPPTTATPASLAAPVGTATPATQAATPTSGPEPPPAPAPVALTRLGIDLRPVSTETCRVPTVATGSAWQQGTVQLEGRDYQDSSFCNLFSGGTGTLDFVLAKGYRELSVTIGFVDDSGSLDHRVRFEIIGDELSYLAEPRTLRFGETVALAVDVSGISRLRLKVTELGRPGGNDAPSKPAFASPRLTPSPG
ncbi:MAG: protein kinase domain-containing protein, partial [Acidimicrobiales bacterium]